MYCERRLLEVTERRCRGCGAAGRSRGAGVLPRPPSRSFWKVVPRAYVQHPRGAVQLAGVRAEGARPLALYSSVPLDRTIRDLLGLLVGLQVEQSRRGCRAL